MNTKGKIGLFWQPLGGNNVDQISGHCYLYTDCVHNSSSILRTSVLIDIGKYDNYSGLGVSGAVAAIPDVRNFLNSEEDDVQAVFITHSHPDHLNGLAHYLKLGYKFPTIYMSPYTKIIFDELFFEMDIPLSAYPKIEEIRGGQKVQVGSMEIEAVWVSHTCFDALGYLITTPNACVFHSGDFKADNSTYFRSPTNFKRLNDFKGKVDCAVLDFCWAMEDGFTPKESDTFKKIISIIKKSGKSKIFLPVYPTHPEMYIIAFLAALKLKKNIIFYGIKDFYIYLNLIKMYGISFADLTKGRIKVFAHPDFASEEDTKNGYIVIGTYNHIGDEFSFSAKDSYAIITATTYFNPLKGQLNLRGIKFVTPLEEPNLQGYGHGFLGDIEKLWQTLGKPCLVPTHCPSYVVDDFKKIMVDLGFELPQKTPLNGDIFQISKGKCQKIGGEVANWLAINYNNPQNQITAVSQKMTSGSGFLRRTISRKKTQRKFKMIAHQRKKKVEADAKV